VHAVLQVEELFRLQSMVRYAPFTDAPAAAALGKVPAGHVIASATANYTCQL